MLNLHFYLRLLVVMLAAYVRLAWAEPGQQLSAPAESETAGSAKSELTIHHFVTGSYQKMLDDMKDQPFVLVAWSVDCPSCMKDMELLRQIHLANPDLKIILLSADDPEMKEQIRKILEMIGLADLETWVFAEDNTQKLLYQIDQSWYGEIPRTYFFDAEHKRNGVSGVLSKPAYEAEVAKILAH